MSNASERIAKVGSETTEIIDQLARLYRQHGPTMEQFLALLIALRQKISEYGATVQELEEARGRFEPLTPREAEHVEPEEPEDAVDPEVPDPVDPVDEEPIEDEPSPEEPPTVEAPLYNTVLYALPDIRLLNETDAVFVDDVVTPTMFFIVEHGIQWDHYLSPPPGFARTPLTPSGAALVTRGR